MVDSMMSINARLLGIFKRSSGFLRRCSCHYVDFVVSSLFLFQSCMARPKAEVHPGGSSKHIVCWKGLVTVIMHGTGHDSPSHRAMPYEQVRIRCLPDIQLQQFLADRNLLFRPSRWLQLFYDEGKPLISEGYLTPADPWFIPYIMGHETPPWNVTL
jgi:hypothetical protein